MQYVLCPDPELNAAAAALQNESDGAGIARIEALLARYRNDPRLLFLKGSLLAARADYRGAEAALSAALVSDPSYAIARFQLGMLQLTSGDAMAALATWGPIGALPETHYLNLFVRGLERMIRDEFAGAAALLEQGIAANTELAPLNKDMRMLVDEMRAGRRPATPQSAAPPSSKATAEPTSSTQFLLNVFRPKGKPH